MGRVYRPHVTWQVFRELAQHPKVEIVSKYPTRDGITSIAYFLHLLVRRPPNIYREAG
jgi:hypothetical protein